MDLKKMNSLTKYPSILTYHQLGERGRLTEELSEGRATRSIKFCPRLTQIHTVN